MTRAIAPKGRKVDVDNEAVASGSGNEQAVLREVVTALLDELARGSGDRDKRRQVEEWMKSLSEKYPQFKIEEGLRNYYLAEAGRLRNDFVNAKDLTEKLNLGRAIESFLDKAADYESRIKDRR